MWIFSFYLSFSVNKELEMDKIEWNGTKNTNKYSRRMNWKLFV